SAHWPSRDAAEMDDGLCPIAPHVARPGRRAEYREDVSRETTSVRRSDLSRHRLLHQWLERGEWDNRFQHEFLSASGRANQGATSRTFQSNSARQPGAAKSIWFNRWRFLLPRPIRWGEGRELVFTRPLSEYLRAPRLGSARRHRHAGGFQFTTAYSKLLG